jgi:hypothetical protein
MRGGRAFRDLQVISTSGVVAQVSSEKLVEIAVHG